MTTVWGDARAKQVLEAGDVSEVERLLLVLRDDAWDDRAFYADVLGSELSLDALDAWCEADADSAIAFLLRGRRLIEEAWEVRGGKAASQTSRPALRDFEQCLRTAEADLRVAIELDPRDPTPHAFFLTVLQGTGRARSHAGQVLDELRCLAPAHYAGHHAMLRAATAKWGGSHEEMFEVARDAEARGGLLPLLHVSAHLERWIGFQMAGDGKAAQTYGVDPAVRAEVSRVVRAVYDGGQVQPGRAGTAPALNVLAFWAFLTRDRDMLRWALELVGATVTQYPWIYLDGLATFHKAQQAARA